MNIYVLKIAPLLIFICCMSQNANIIAQGQTPISKNDSTTEYNCCPELKIDKKGDTICTVFCSIYRFKVYSFNTVYFKNMPSHLMIYCHDINKLVAEFAYDKWKKNKWVRADYHAKSVPYRKLLLKKYLKTKDFIQYEQVQIE